MNDEITQLLENNKLRQEVIKTIQSVWRYAGTLYDNPDEDMQKYLEENKESSLWEEAWWRAETFGEIHKIFDKFDKYVIQKMAKPYRLTLEELVKAFLDLATPDERHYTEFEGFSSDDYNNLYTIFVNYVKNNILSYRHSNPFPICAVTYEQKEFQPEDSNSEDGESEKPLWQKNDVSVSLLRGADLIEERPLGKKLYHILAFIEGNISTSACRNLQTEMGRILPTAVRSADLLQTTGFGNGKIIGNIGHGAFLTFQREIEGLPWGDEYLLENGKPLIRQYLDAYYNDSPGKKDSIGRRIRNAVCLLIESDNQPNNAVGLALSITAIEALLGENVKELSTMLAERVGALLEPYSNQRDNTLKFVKNLYKTRSRALHGELVETETEARINARHLAAAVLSGMFSRRDFLHRAGYEPESPQELLQDLDKSFARGQATGVEEYNIRELWRNRKAGKKDSSL